MIDREYTFSNIQRMLWLSECGGAERFGRYNVAGNREFGNLIRALREAKKKTDPKYSLRQFAVAVGISATYLSKVETGDFDPPAPDKIKRIAELLGYNPDELLALAGRVDPELNDIIRKQPREMAEFLRTVSGMSSAQLKKLTDRARRDQDGQ